MFGKGDNNKKAKTKYRRKSNVPVLKRSRYNKGSFNDQQDDIRITAVQFTKADRRKEEREVKKQYNPAFCTLVYRLALLGLKNDEMAPVFGISLRQFHYWLELHTEFREAMMRGKEQADGAVVAALFTSAVGFHVNEEVILSNRVKTYDENGKVIEEHTEPLRVPVKKYYPPNVKAAIKWLERRHPGEWGNLKTVNVNHSVALAPVDVKEYTDEELLVLEKVGMKQLKEHSEDDE